MLQVCFVKFLLDFIVFTPRKAELGRRIRIEKKTILKKLKNNKDHRMFGRKRGGNHFGYTPREDQQNKKGNDQGSRKSVFTAG